MVSDSLTSPVRCPCLCVSTRQTLATPAIKHRADDNRTAHCGDRYCVATDPLDGSSNIDCNISTGTIFGIYHRADGADATVATILRPGSELICAGYCMYGSSTQVR